MSKIERIPQIEMIKKYRGKTTYVISLITLLLFLVGGLLFIYQGVTKSSFYNTLIGVFFILFFIVLAHFLFKGGEYNPRKSFHFIRMDKNKTKKYIYYSLFLIVFIYTLILIADQDQGVKISGYILSSFIIFYYWSKSIKLHEDIDHTTNQFVSELIELKIDEKIVTSYQNFESTSPTRQDNDNFVVLTSRKIFFGVYNGTNWMILNKSLGQITRIGIAQNDTDYYLNMTFVDHTAIDLRLELLKKITTTPNLFIRKLLTTLDAFLLGYDVVAKDNRRRVSIPSVNYLTKKHSRSNATANPTIGNNLEASDTIKPGRNLEI